MARPNDVDSPLKLGGCLQPVTFLPPPVPEPLDNKNRIKLDSRFSILLL